MSRATIVRTTVDGHDALAIENTHLRAVVLPGLGGRVWTLEDRPRRRQWIWHRGTVPLAVCAPGASYDDVWAGGWEELFPNDAAGAFEGRDLPDHGEWWTMAWDAQVSEDAVQAQLRLTATSRSLRAACVKTFSLPHDGAGLSVSYAIRSLEDRPFHFLFKQHLPVNLTPGCRLVLPGGRVEAVDPAFGTLLSGPGPFDWPPDSAPAAGQDDLRVIPPRSSGSREFVYVSGLPAPWCGVDDVEGGASLRMEFDATTFPFTWLFLSYGGWRDVYTAVLEPCTNKPKDLAEAVRLGQSAMLEPGQEFTTTVTVRLAGLAAGER